MQILPTRHPSDRFQNFHSDRTHLFSHLLAALYSITTITSIAQRQGFEKMDRDERPVVPDRRKKKVPLRGTTLRTSHLSCHNPKNNKKKPKFVENRSGERRMGYARDTLMKFPVRPWRVFGALSVSLWRFDVGRSIDG